MDYLPFFVLLYYYRLGEAFDKMRENQKPTYDGKTTEPTTTTTTTTQEEVELKPEYIRQSNEFTKN